ncbi:MAG: hypothetical protein IPM52_10255 [Bacteroidetes bacterium]|nr:hypothetical protein [Bacteroidota bacterium]
MKNERRLSLPHTAELRPRAGAGGLVSHQKYSDTNEDSEEVLDYIAQAPEQQQQIMKQLIDLIDRKYRGQREFQMEPACFCLRKRLCLFQNRKKESPWAFLDRSKLTDARQQLQGTGKAFMPCENKSPDELADFPQPVAPAGCRN